MNAESSRVTPMVGVVRVQTGRGSHIEPPLDEDWDERTQVAWKLGVLAAETGIVAVAHEGGLRRDGEPVPGTWSLTIGSRSLSAFTLDRLWVAVSFLQIGVELARDRWGALLRAQEAACRRTVAVLRDSYDSNPPPSVFRRVQMEEARAGAYAHAIELLEGMAL